MATVINGSQVKLNSGQTVQASQGGWYDGQQFWGGTLSAPGVINAQSNQQGAGQAVSKEVVQQTNPANWDYIQKQQQSYQPSGTSQPMPSAGATSAGTTGAGVGFQAPQDTFDPTKFYESAYASSGIRDIEAKLSAQTMAYNEQVSKIKDNPYLSEATMTGRISKLDQKFAADTAALKNDIATKKADIETQLNLQLKKIDINSAASKQALDQFNSLLSSGALAGASGEDIANITRATGISSSMVQSAINAQKAKNVETSTISWDDGTNQGFAVINSKTGEIINKQTVAASKPKATGTSAASSTESFNQTAATISPQMVNGTWWGIFPQLIKQYAPYMTLEQIRKLYLQSEPGKMYGEPSENAAEMKQLYDYIRTGKES